MTNKKKKTCEGVTRNVPPQLLAYPGDRSVIVILSVMFVLVVAYLAGSLVYDRYERNKYKAVCEMVESHPDLSVPCECALGTKKDFEQLLMDQGVYDKVKDYFCVCRCLVDADNNVTQVFAVPIAK